MACDECRDLLGGYVLDSLEPDETQAVRAHLVGCAECSREHAALVALPALLDAAGTTEAAVHEPPAALEAAVLDRFARERPPATPSRWRRWLTRPIPVAAGAAVAAALVTLAVTAALNGSSSEPAHVYSAALRGSAIAPGARAYARLASESSGTRVRLYVHGLQPAPGAVYELWCIGDNGERISAGTFRVDSSGGAEVSLTTAARLGDYHRLSVERTVARGRGQRVLAGSIAY
jgi:Anti-sigma-K factor rskA/Putative zinc-finger